MRKLVRITKPQFSKVKTQIKRLCCSYVDGNCLLLDGLEPCPCSQLITQSLLCKWCRNAVLPYGKALYNEIICRENRKACVLCGVSYYSMSNHSKYCSVCAVLMKRKQQAEYARKKRLHVEK